MTTDTTPMIQDRLRKDCWDDLDRALHDEAADALDAAQIALSEMRRDRDFSKADARQWKADARKSEADAIAAQARIAVLEAVASPDIKGQTP